MSTYGDVIRSARVARGLNQQALADRLGISRNTLAGWETGHSRPGLDMVPALCRVLHISLAHFFGVKASARPGDKDLLEKLHALSEADREVIIWEIEALLERRRAVVPLQLVSLYESDLGAAAGFGAPLDEAAGSRIWLIRDELTARADEVITVSGQSMQPTFRNGERVLVEHTKELRPGEIGVFLVDGEGYIKEYREDGLHSHNPAYGVMRMSDGADVRCVGRVLGKVTPEHIPTKEQINSFAGTGKAREGAL